MADTAVERLGEELSGLDALELAAATVTRKRRLVDAAWPKLAAVALVLGAWQLVVALELKPAYVVPGPATVLAQIWKDARTGDLFAAVGITMARAAIGYIAAVVVGTVLGIAISRVKVLRAAVGSLLTGLQTMPSIAWFPLAILLFKLSETAILFVVVLGGAPAIANGLVSGVDHIPPQLLRAGRVLGARGLRSLRHVVLPAALPGYVSGLKQGWAFAWRSLMAGELLVIVAGRPSIGVRLQFAREFADAPALMATMVVTLAVGIAIDSLGFGVVDRALRRRRGLAT